MVSSPMEGDSDVESGLSRPSNEGEQERRPLLHNSSTQRMTDPEAQLTEERESDDIDEYSLLNALEHIVNENGNEGGREEANTGFALRNGQNEDEELQRLIRSWNLSYTCCVRLR